MTHARIRRTVLIGVLMGVAAGGSGSDAVAQPLVLEEGFDNGIESWERIRLDRRQTTYSHAMTGGEAVLVAASRGQAAGFLRRFETPPPARAVLEWRWRVSNSLAENGGELTRRGDDYAARVFVMFGKDAFKRGTRALSYVWAGQQPVGSRYRNPVVDDIATIVLRSGDRSAGKWVSEQRNVLVDYEEAFGEPPPGISGIAIVVDTDDTNSEVISWFDDFRLEVQPVPDGTG